METGRTLRERSRPVTGWRAWIVTETGDGLQLGSVLHDVVWHHGDALVAECRRADDPFAEPIAPHPVPAAECNCGFHATRDPVDALSYARGRDEHGTVCRILGEVLLWGHVLETERGWRASHAYPLRLYIPESTLEDALSAYGAEVCALPSSPTCTATPSASALRLPTSRRASLT